MLEGLTHLRGSRDLVKLDNGLVGVVPHCRRLVLKALQGELHTQLEVDAC